MLDELLKKLEVSNVQLVRASREQLTFKNVQKGRTGHRLTPNIQDKILNALLAVKPGLKLSRRDLFRYDMDESAIQKLQDANARIGARKITYPQYADLLLEAGFTRYSVDIAAQTYTYFGVGGEAYEETQKGSIDYPTFLKRIQAAGIVSYEVNLRAREIRYRSETMTYKEQIPPVVPVIPEPKKQMPPPAKKFAAKKKKSAGRSVVSLKGRKAAKRARTAWKKGY